SPQHLMDQTLRQVGDAESTVQEEEKEENREELDGWPPGLSEAELIERWTDGEMPEMNLEIWYRHGLDVANKYLRELEGWSPEWKFSEALDSSLERDAELRLVLRRWHNQVTKCRFELERGGKGVETTLNHREFVHENRFKMPAGIRIPLVSNKLDLPSRLRYRLWGGQGNATLKLAIRKLAKDRTNYGIDIQNRLIEQQRLKDGEPSPNTDEKQLVKTGEFAQHFSESWPYERKEMDAWRRMVETAQTELTTWVRNDACS
ncbi:MAG: hypothetical protein MJA30_14235, partial [Cytophagales bacterium]|nr:hypothetical protein [Cytophagales bacterium]